MSELRITNIKPIQASYEFNGLYLVLLYANKIPPHLGIIHQSRYYSISAKGKDVGNSVKPLLKAIQQKHIPTLFVELFEETAVTEAVLNNSFNAIEQLTDEITCLAPIVSFLNELKAEQSLTSKFVYELIPELQSQELITDYLSLNIEGTDLNIPHYSMKDVLSRIQKYQKSTV